MFYEHAHLTFEGNCLLARTLAEQIEELLPQGASPENPAWPTIADCARRLGRTDRDLPAALSDILSRLTDPPFTTQINHDEQMERLAEESRRAGVNASLSSALHAAQAAVDAAPEDAPLYEQLSALELAANHPAEAEKAARRLVDLLPSGAEGWSQLGFTFVQQKKYDEAMKAYQRAFDLNPQDVFPLQNLAMSLTKLGRNPEAMREYEASAGHYAALRPGLAGPGSSAREHGPQERSGGLLSKSIAEQDSSSFRTGDPGPILYEPRMVPGGLHQLQRCHQTRSIQPSTGGGSRPGSFSFGMQLGKSGQAAAAAREFQAAVLLMPETVEAR